jgi:thiol peroxidase
MNTRKGIVTMKGNPLTLIGDELKVGQPAPDFEVLDNDLKPVRFSSFKGKVCVLSSVPSLDTPVCDMETRKFNRMAAGLSAGYWVLLAWGRSPVSECWDRDRRR